MDQSCGTAVSEGTLKRTEVSAPAASDAGSGSDKPIASGAEAGAFQTDSPCMPDPQVDAAAFWSRAGLAPKGADGQTLPMPSLGYSLPNGDRSQKPEARIQNLQLAGLGNSRAAQALRAELTRELKQRRGDAETQSKAGE